MRRRPRILWFKARMPKALTDGSSTASLNLAECLAEDFDLDLVSLRLRGNEDRIAPSLKSFSSVTLVDPDNAGHALRRASYRLRYEAESRFTGIPRGALYESCSSVRRTLSELHSSRDYDLLHLEYWTASPLLSLPLNIPKVIYFHDATYRKYEQLAREATSSANRGRLTRRAEKLRDYERCAARLADAAHFIADEDRRALRDAGAPRGIHIPLLFPLQGTSAAPETDQPHVLFLGSLGYSPNAEGVTWLVKHVLPRIRESCPEVRLRIAGPGISPAIRQRLQATGVDLIGWVEDLPALYADSAVVVAPILKGTGVSVKVLEAMWYRRAVVTTSVGGRATPATSGAAIIADDPSAFAEGVLALLRNRGRREQLANCAWRRLYDDHMSPEIRQRVKDAFRFFTL